MLTYDGISTTLLAMYAPRRATAGGTTRTPAGREARRRRGRRTWSAPCRRTRTARRCRLRRATRIGALSARRNDSSTAFLSHWCVVQAPSTFSATRSRPASSSAITWSTASRTARGRRVRGERRARLPGGVDRALQVGHDARICGAKTHDSTPARHAGPHGMPTPQRWRTAEPSATVPPLHRLEPMRERAAHRRAFRRGP